jgi:hypothetical protein
MHDHDARLIVTSRNRLEPWRVPGDPTDRLGRRM